MAQCNASHPQPGHLNLPPPSVGQAAQYSSPRGPGGAWAFVLLINQGPRLLGECNSRGMSICFVSKNLPIFIHTTTSVSKNQKIEKTPTHLRQKVSENLTPPTLVRKCQKFRNSLQKLKPTIRLRHTIRYQVALEVEGTII